MRFITRILVGVAAAGALLAGGLTGTASAATPGGFQDAWGVYSSADGKAEAAGKVVVKKKAHKKGYWKKYPKTYEKCWWVKKKKHGKWVKTKVCKTVTKWEKKWVWKWVYTYDYSVYGKLVNKKSWGPKKYQCAWATFKVQEFDGDTYFKSFNKCHKGAKGFAFEGKDAKHIWVQVARGDFHKPKGFHSGWESVYHAA